MKPLIVSSGEPAGVGPDLCLHLRNSAYPLVIAADKHLLAERADRLNAPLTIEDYHGQSIVQRSDHLYVKHVPLKVPCTPGQLQPQNSAYVLEILEYSIKSCMEESYSAFVTAPVHKAIINEAGFPFSGHTEFLQQHCAIKQVVMMLAGEPMRVALFTTHVPLARVPQALNTKHLEKALSILYSALQQDFGIQAPNICVAGLNPHAGENGFLGREDIDIIQPCLENFRNQGMAVYGPYSADTMFSIENNQKYDAYFAMYHDQGLPVLKYACFGRAANITLGLPIIRTSVDHGTALELAASHQINMGSMDYAIQAAWEMAERKQQCKTSPSSQQ